MDAGSRLSLVIVVFLLFFAAYFAAAETAFASVSRIRLKTRMDKGDARAKRALRVADNFDKAITTILIGTNIVHLAAASLVTVVVTRKWGVSAVTLSTFVTTIVVFFVGEMLPKSIAKKYSERMALATASSLCFFMTIFTPVSSVLTAIGRGVSRLTKGDGEVSVTEDELYDIIEDMTDEGALSNDRGDLISSALQFSDVTADTVLTARVLVDHQNMNGEANRAQQQINIALFDGQALGDAQQEQPYKRDEHRQPHAPADAPSHEQARKRNQHDIQRRYKAGLAR